MDLSSLKDLEYADITSSASTIDLSKCTKLKHLVLFMPNLTSNDLSHNPALEYLDTKNVGTIKDLVLKWNRLRTVLLSIWYWWI